MDARLNQMLTASVYLQGSVPMNGSGTVEGCTKHRSPRNDGIRHVQVTQRGVLDSGTAFRIGAQMFGLKGSVKKVISLILALAFSVLTVQAQDFCSQGGRLH
jgi:hypothetical protein